MQLIQLGNTELQVTISSIGAEIQSIRDKNGVERIWNGDPAFWTGRAPVLFPVAGGFKDDCYTLNGVKYQMPKHGFVRKIEWQVERADDTSATFLMTDKHPGFPFDYELRATYALKGNAVQVDYSVTNKDSQTFYYSLGSHEAYACPEGIESYQVVFDQPEKLDCSRIVGNLIECKPYNMGENVKALPLKYDYFKVDALVFAHIKSRGVVLESSLHNRKVRVDYPDCPVLMLWTKPGAGYLCIEPWLNAPDYEDADGMIEHKPGCICLAPGCEKTVTHTLTFIG